MIYVDNTSEYSQRIYIPKDEEVPSSGVTGHTFSLQRKDYDISGNGAYRIHPDAGFDGISGGTIAVYVTAATGITPEHLDVTEDGVYVPTGDSVYTGITVQVYDNAYQDGYHDGYSDGYQSGYTRGHTDGYTDGYSSGETDGYNTGYTSGHTDGYREGYSSGHTDGYSEGRDDGYSEGYTDGSNSGYDEGYRVGYAAGYSEGRSEGYQNGLADGVARQKALLTSETFTQNGQFTREDGWSAVTISIPGGSYNEGYQDGIDYQKSLLGTYNFTANTGPEAITFENGISAATVNIPLSDIIVTATTNGQYNYFATDGLYSSVQFTVDVPQSGSSPILTAGAFDANGQYYPPEGVDGFSSVYVGVNTAQTYNDGYSEGYSSGSTDGYSSGYTDGVNWRNAQDISGRFTSNGTYTRDNGFGWNEVVVNVDTASTYTNGYTDGTNYQKSLLGSTAFTSNGNYTNANGWSAVTVNMDTASTYNAGMAAQKALLTSTTITNNGTYTRANGWSGVTVNIPLTSTTITSNGTYTRQNGGYSSVTVNVPTTQVVTMTQAQYNALSVKDNNTIYLIKD